MHLQGGGQEPGFRGQGRGHASCTCKGGARNQGSGGRAGDRGHTSCTRVQGQGRGQGARIMLQGSGQVCRALGFQVRCAGL